MTDFIIVFSNVAEALIGKGLANVIKYSINDDQRSAFYDELLAAENHASKNMLKLHSKKDAPIHRVADIAGVRIGIYLAFDYRTELSL